jgi:hypothetical protein
MLEQTTRSVVVVLLLSSVMLLSGCMHFTQASRREAAYAKYIRKYSRNRVRGHVKYKHVKMPKPPRQDLVNTSLGPVSVSSSSSTTN